MNVLKASFLLSTIIGSMLLAPLQAFAVTAGDWQPGRIIDDQVFTDAGSMSVSQIQAFLNSKVPICDTNGTQNTTKWNSAAGRYYTRAEWGALQGYPSPFTCLRDFYEVPKTEPSPGVPANNYGGKPIPQGARSAAQLIWDAAQASRISPKVLLTTIQKESYGPLTADDWPFSYQYTYAMGAHCPDGPNGANCDPDYAGFSIQIRESASLFRYYLDNMNQPWWPYKKLGNNHILWNVQYSTFTNSAGQAQPCGGANVNIITSATAALYTYTPYQPSPAVLQYMNTSVPEGNGFDYRCAAYGNRNFWRIYNDWFGSTRAMFASKPATTTNYALSPCNLGSYDPSYVGRLYQPDTGDYLYTPNSAEACEAVKYGFIWDGIVFRSPQKTDTGAIPVYRLSDGFRHYYTESTEKRTMYIDSGFRDEGIGFYALSTSQPGSLPVYKLTYGPTTLYTSAGAEGQLMVQAHGYNSQGIAFYTMPQDPGTKQLFRLANSRGQRFYTISSQESASAQSFGYRLEGAASMSNAMPDSNNMPVYRLRGAMGHFYTIDRIERDRAVIDHAFISEGIGFYGPTSGYPGSTPLTRATNYQYGVRLYSGDSAEISAASSKYGYSLEGTSWFSYPQ